MAIKVGIVGLGFMGMTHYRAFDRVEGAEVVAICSRSPEKRRGDWSSIRGNFGSGGGFEELSNIRTYSELSAILDDQEIEMIDICLPTNLHYSAVVEALNAGKHVLVEKPMALDFASTIEMRKVAKDRGKLLMVAHVLPFFPEFAYALEVVKSGKYGKLIGGDFKRIISPPSWSSTISELEKSGGAGLDLHVHDTHFVQLLCGKPDALFSQGKLLKDRFAEYISTQYIYRDLGITMSCTSGSIAQSGREFSHGFELFLEDATLIFEFATFDKKPTLIQPLTLMTDDGKIAEPNISADPMDAFVAELNEAILSIEANSVSTFLSAEVASEALLSCEKEVESARSGQIINL